MRSEYLPNEEKTYDARMDGVLAQGSKIFDDIADLGYMVAELASWVGPTSTDAPQEASYPPQDTSEGVEAPHTPSATPQRLTISRQHPSYGQDDPGRGLGVGHAQAGVPQAGERPLTPP